MTELWKLSAVDMADGIRDRRFKPSELMASVVARVSDQNPRLNAITVDLTESAIEAAADADRVVDAGGELGPLHGVPVTIKENIDMSGLPSTNGVPAYANTIATEDAPLVRNLRNAGAIVIGRTNTPEFSMRLCTDNPLRGRTLNPWDEQASPGGSSGGAGAAAAAGLSPLNHGNDIAGSLRFPSFANGVTTVKPTTFRIPVYNASAPAERGPLSQAMSVQGIIARHAADVRLATRVMIEPDPRDPNSPPIPWDGADLGGRPTVAVTTQTGGYDMHPGILKLILEAADQLRDAGYEVVEIDPPEMTEPAKAWFGAGATEVLSTLGPAVEQNGSETIRQIFGWYAELTDTLDRDGFIAAFGDRTRMMRDWNLFLNDYPLVLTPFLMRPTYDWDYDTRGFDEVKDLFDAAIYSTGVNFLGLPAGVIGTGLVENRPAAIQIIGRRYREDLICDALEAIEHRNGVLTHQLW